MRRIALAPIPLVMLSLLGCSTAPATLTPEPFVQLTGKGNTRTLPFTLGTGNYDVTWAVPSADEQGACPFSGVIAPHEPDPPLHFQAPFGNDQPATQGQITGTLHLPPTLQGSYDAVITTTCVWTLTFQLVP
jgi:hypothetical protein